VLLVAPTGGGKTEAAVAPSLELALEARVLPYVLYVAPTRALINDLEKRLREPVRKLGQRVAVQHGERRTIEGATPPILILTTPESLEVMLSSSSTYGARSLKNIRSIIIDEIHEYQGTRRGLQLSLLIRKLEYHASRRVQKIGLSATVADPVELAHDMFGDHSSVRVLTVETARNLEAHISVVGAEQNDSSSQSLSQWADEIVSAHDKVLVFCNTRQECDWLCWQLSKSLNVPTFLHYSSLDKDYRRTVEKRFAESRRAVCVATSTLELGIDIGDVGAVAMWGAPQSVSSFLQRIGRGNRRSHTQRVHCACPSTHPDGRPGNPSEDALRYGALLYAVFSGSLERDPMASFFSVILQQLLTICLRYGKVAPDAFFALVNPAPSFVTERTLRAMLDTLRARGLLEYNAVRDLWYPTSRFRALVSRGLLWSNLVQNDEMTVESERPGAKQTILDVPKKFGRSLRVGDVVLFAGKPRVVVWSGATGLRVRELNDGNAVLAEFYSLLEPQPRSLAESLRELLRRGLGELTSKGVVLDDASMRAIEGATASLGVVLREKDFVYRYEHGSHVLYTFGGTTYNWLLSDSIALLSGVQNQSDAWKIRLSRYVSIEKLLNGVTVNRLKKLISQQWSEYLRRISVPPLFNFLPAELQHEEITSVLDVEGATEWMKSIAQSLGAES